MSVKLWKEESILHEDIPIVPFEKGKAQIQKMIQESLIRHIRGIQLGYVAYMEPDYNISDVFWQYGVYLNLFHRVVSSL